MTEQLRTLAAFPKDPSSVSSTHIRQLKHACNSSSSNWIPHFHIFLKVSLNLLPRFSLYYQSMDKRITYALQWQTEIMTRDIALSHRYFLSVVIRMNRRETEELEYFPTFHLVKFQSQVYSSGRYSSQCWCQYLLSPRIRNKKQVIKLTCLKGLDSHFYCWVSGDLKKSCCSFCIWISAVGMDGVFWVCATFLFLWL